jgi:hypothetical protein
MSCCLATSSIESLAHLFINSKITTTAQSSNIDSAHTGLDGIQPTNTSNFIFQSMALGHKFPEHVYMHINNPQGLQTCHKAVGFIFREMLHMCHGVSTHILHAINDFFFPFTPHNFIHEHLLRLWISAILLHCCHYLNICPLTYTSWLAVCFQCTFTHKHDYLLMLLCCSILPLRCIFRQLQAGEGKLSQLQQISALSSLGPHYSLQLMAWLLLSLDLISVLSKLNLLIKFKSQRSLQVLGIYCKLQSVTFYFLNNPAEWLPLLAMLTVFYLATFEFVWCQLHTINVPCFYLLIQVCFALMSMLLILELATVILNYISCTDLAPCDWSLTSEQSLCLTGQLTPCGGGRARVFTQEMLDPYMVACVAPLSRKLTYKFVGHVDSTGLCNYPISQGYIHVNVPLQQLMPLLPGPAVLSLAHIHKIPMSSHTPRKHMQTYFDHHNCISCNLYCSVFECTTVKPCGMLDAPKPNRTADPIIPEGPVLFPPTPLDSTLSHKIIKSFCAESDPATLEEAGCAICGRLIRLSKLSKLKSVGNLLHILNMVGVTRVERTTILDKIEECKGPVIDNSCNQLCNECRWHLRAAKIPCHSLANGLWLGPVPEQLANLRFVERLLIQWVRVNGCFVHVASSGLCKMVAHVIAFESPIAKVYNSLPPPLEDLDDVLAILFTGPCKPTPTNTKCTPLLVQQGAVARALEWLKLNHRDYADLSIAYNELQRYPEDTPPVTIEYQHSMTNKVEEGISTFDQSIDDGVENGECPFIVHGITGESLTTKTVGALKGLALRHWNNNRGALSVSHAADAELIYNNPNLYPQIFPWLFPYGLGGIGSSAISDKAHKRHLLMYHDKRFQQDPMFPFVAFSHEQIKASITGGFILAETEKFNDIANRLLSVDQHTLENIAKQMSEGEIVHPANDDEELCFQVIRDLDHVNGKVSGSITSKKYMRNKIWSLISFLGAPLWYITLSPADTKHPICLYFADTKETFHPFIRLTDDRFRLIAENPVAGARFFHFMVQMFIKHILGIDSVHRGLYGDTSGYHGTVEQQGRLTLHLHMLVWIKGALSPEEMRSKIRDSDSDFCQSLIKYLESCHAGEFLTGDKNKVATDVDVASTCPDYQDPTETLPLPPPNTCGNPPCLNCPQCETMHQWTIQYASTVDDLILRSNIHSCTSNRNRDGSESKARSFKGCLDNIWGCCNARFPRNIFEQSEVDPETGSLNLKKKEAWMNTLTYVVTYLLRCNTNVTSLRSGTAIKGVLLYVTNYVTKSALKTHVVFDTVRSIFQKNSELIGGTDSRQAKAR